MPFKQETVPAFIQHEGGINHIYSGNDQYEHIIKPTSEWMKYCIEQGGVDTGAVIFCPPACGKTTVFTHDSVWRNSAIMAQNGMKNQLHIITAPEIAITESVLLDIKNKYSSDEFHDKFAEHGILRTVTNNPDDLIGRNVEILVCSIQLLADNKENARTQKKLKELLEERGILPVLYSDEVQKGLGCPEGGATYTGDVGHSGYEYEAVWFQTVYKMPKLAWFMYTGTPTLSMETEYKDYYKMISVGMEKASWRLPFPVSSPTLIPSVDVWNGNYINLTFHDLAKQNAINLYLKSKIDSDILEMFPEFKSVKVTAFFKCGTQSQDVPGVFLNNKLWKGFCKQAKGKTFIYDGVELKYHIGKIATLTDDIKTFGTNLETFDALNENENYVAVSAVMIGGTGINVLNLRSVTILPYKANKGGIDHSYVQLLNRLARCKFAAWRNDFDIRVAQIKSKEQRKAVIDLALAMSEKKAFIHEDAELPKGAYNKMTKGHVMYEDARGFLEGLVSTKLPHFGTEGCSGQDRDIEYRNLRKDRCEIEGCTCYEDLVINGTEKSEAEREVVYRQCLQVDHIDGDRTNMNPENLLTVCPNRHQFKTIFEKDYLNSYDKAA